MFRSAKKKDAKHFGQGILRANDALGIVPGVGELVQTPEDELRFSLFRALPDWKRTQKSIRHMLEVEALQLVESDAALFNAVGDPEILPPKNVPSSSKGLVELLLNDTRTSDPLRNFLTKQKRKMR